MALVEYEDKAMTIAEHLEELRWRLLWSLAGVFAGTLILWSWSTEVLGFLSKPTEGLIFVAPTEALFTRIKVAFFSGFLLALPVVIYQSWAFVARALGAPVRRTVAVILPASYALFLAGASLSAFFVVPLAVKFLLSYGSSEVQPMLSVGSYIDFVTALSMAFGLVFQMPLVLMFFNRAGLLRRAALSEKRRYVYVIGFVVAALMTPPDPLSQMALAIPILVLFEGSLIAMRFTEPDS